MGGRDRNGRNGGGSWRSNDNNKGIMEYLQLMYIVY
jgi:hypothetical protein